MNVADIPVVPIAGRLYLDERLIGPLADHHRDEIQINALQDRINRLPRDLHVLLGVGAPFFANGGAYDEGRWDPTYAMLHEAQARPGNLRDAPLSPTYVPDQTPGRELRYLLKVAAKLHAEPRVRALNAPRLWRAAVYDLHGGRARVTPNFPPLDSRTAPNILADPGPADAEANYTPRDAVRGLYANPKRRKDIAWAAAQPGLLVVVYEGRDAMLRLVDNNFRSLGEAAPVTAAMSVCGTDPRGRAPLDMTAQAEAGFAEIRARSENGRIEPFEFIPLR